MGTRRLGNLTGDRYRLLISAEEAKSGTATVGGGPRPFLFLLFRLSLSLRPMITLNHIGIAVSDPKPLERLFELLGLKKTHTEPVAEQGVVTHFIPLPVVPSSLELLEPTDPDGTIAKFIQKKGTGIHHLSFLVGKGDLDAMSAQLRAEGYRLVYDAPKKGAHQMRINFIHPASAGGILIELMESGA